MGGTGSSPSPPHGLQLITLRMVNINALTIPWVRKASIAYCEHVGVYLQVRGSIGEIKYWYIFTSRMKNILNTHRIALETGFSNTIFFHLSFFITILTNPNYQELILYLVISPREIIILYFYVLHTYYPVTYSALKMDMFRGIFIIQKWVIHFILQRVTGNDPLNDPLFGQGIKISVNCGFIYPCRHHFFNFFFR